MIKKGLIQIYTGEGKGKTTASVGLAVRAQARGMRVCYVCFHKNPQKYGQGEFKSLKKLGIEVRYFAKSHPFCSRGKGKKKSGNLRSRCLKGINFIQKIYLKNKFDLLVLDEINICLRDGFLKEEEILTLLKEKPKGLELVFTGRGATKRLINKADLVSFIKEIKHPYKQGINARKGIEY